MRPHHISFKAVAQLLVMANGNLTGWRRIIKAFGFSMQGFKSCYQLEEAFRHEVWALVPLVPLGLWFGETPLERAMLVGSLLIIPIVELLNSAIEANVDRVGLGAPRALRAGQGYRLRRRLSQHHLCRRDLGPVIDS